MVVETNRREVDRDRVAVVLAAGLGTRLASPDSPKPVAPVRHVPLLIRTLRSLEITGCSRAVVVLGHKADSIRRETETAYRGPLDLQFAYNPDYMLQNGISVLCARSLIGDEFILTMADHIFEDPIMELVRSHRPPQDGAILCVDYKVDAIFDLDDATKVLARDEVLQEIGKQLVRFNCIDTGAFICTQALLEALEQVRSTRGDASLSDGVQQLASSGKMHVLDIGGSFWQDVDTPEMMAHAEAELSRRANRK